MKCCYSVLQSVTKVSNVVKSVTKCYKNVKCFYKVLHCVRKCQMLLQNVAKWYKSVKCCYKVLQSVTKVSNVVTKFYKSVKLCYKKSEKSYCVTVHEDICFYTLHVDGSGGTTP